MSSSQSDPSKSKSIEGSRVALGRMSAQLTRSELANLLGVAPRELSKFEREGAPAAFLSELSEATKLPASFYLKEPAELLDQESVFFRARRRATLRQRSAATAYGRLGIEMYGWIASRFSLPEVDLPELDRHDPLGAAATVRALWGLHDRPLPNLVQLAESRGIRVLGLPRVADEVDAFTVWENRRPYVFLSLRKTPERTRFDLAHEIGHVLLHSYSPSGGSAVPETDMHVEREADEFASAFLLPRKVLVNAVGFEPSINQILELKSSFGVSAMAMTKSLADVGCFSDWGYKQACIRLSQMGYRRAEPAGMRSFERSRVFSFALKHVRQDLRMSNSEFVDQLGLTLNAVHDFTLGAMVLPVSGVEHPRNAGSLHPRAELRRIK